jgi:LVIVD repeat
MSPCRVPGYLKVGFLALFLTLLPLLALGGGDEGIKPGKPERVPFTGPVPKANCGPGDRTESGLQGETTQEERFSGDSELGYNCNLELVGQQPQGAFEGAFSQNGPAYYGDCAYYGTDRVTSLQQHLGVTVIDASDPRHPRVSAYLDDTAAARAPHETLATNERSHLLVVAENNGPNFAVYDLSADCRHPVFKSSIDLPGSQGHMGAFAPDGRTYYISQSFRGIGGFLYIVDLSDPSHPQQLPTWQFLGDGRPHAPYLNPEGFQPGVPEGTRLYAGQPGQFGAAPTDSSFGPDGLVILDVSDYQFRRPNPEIRIISKLFWDDQGQAESMIPVKIKGHPYLISTDEAGGAGGAGGWAAACARGASAFGYPQIIDVRDETNPKIIAKLMLEVSDPANCSALLAGTPPDPPGTAPGTNLPAISGTTNYSEETCVADNPNNARMLACSFQHAGLRVFDVRDPYHPKEIAYWKPPAVRTEVQPSSGSWASGVDRTIDKIAHWARWRKHGRELHLWTVSDGNGFQILRFKKPIHKLLGKDKGKDDDDDD